MHIVLGRSGGEVVATRLDDDGTTSGVERMPADRLPGWVARAEADRPRWVWDDTARWLPPLLDADVRVDRCVDLRLCHAILRRAAWSAGSQLATSPEDAWDRLAPDAPAAPRSDEDALFALDAPPPAAEPDPVAEFARQRAAVEGSTEPGRLGLLLAAESVGALVAAELRFVGVPWRADRHDELLADLLGPRPAPGQRPARMAALLDRVRAALDDPEADPDSPVALLRSLRNAGIRVESTRSWDLKEVKHPAIEPLLEYKKLARLLSANGWHWVTEWVHDGWDPLESTCRHASLSIL